MSALPFLRCRLLWTGLSACLFALLGAAAGEAPGIGEAIMPLEGAWRFAFDPTKRGVEHVWQAADSDRFNWRTIEVPHTWQVESGNESYQGVAWYAREIAAPGTFDGKSLRLEFDAVNRDATVWVNGVLLGEHVGSGYTAFALSIPVQTWKWGKTNVVVVRVDNGVSTNAFPYERSFDWPMDGGIIRGVRLRGLPPVHLDPIRVAVKTTPALSRAMLRVPTRVVGVVGGTEEGLRVVGTLFDPAGFIVLEHAMEPRNGEPREWAAEIDRPVLWHFDAPRLYRLALRLEQAGKVVHERSVTFGVRRLEVQTGRFVLNGEPMRLMGVEWMPGSDPRHGLAEDPRMAREILEDLKRLNCVLTRFHWQQDPALFEFCDREGMLVQEEVPVWGKHPLGGDRFDRLYARHLEEMILPHFNHPSIIAWGLGNEIKGGSEAGREFVRQGMARARALDPTRLLSYASNTLQPNPGPDAAGFTDLIEWNEYFGTWYPGGTTNIPVMLDKIQAAFPGKGVLISEYGLCACDPKFPEGDEHRIEVLRSHTDAYRAHPAVAGAIFFSYNDYRTHMGDKGHGSFQQRVHGVVNLMRERKPSYEALRRECSPIRTLEILDPETVAEAGEVRVRLVTRALETDLPAYTLRGYGLVWTITDAKGLPTAAGKMTLPDLPPGTDQVQSLAGSKSTATGKVRVEVFRPSGYSVMDAVRQTNETRR